MSLSGPARRVAAEVLRILPRKGVSRALGRAAELELPASVLRPFLSVYVRAYGVDMLEAEIPHGGFRSFDAFFTRRLKSGARPVATESEVAVSPADGSVEACGRIDENLSLEIKGTHYTLEALIADAEVADAYQGGSYLVVYLSPRDYHRVHAPIAGNIAWTRYIQGTLYPVNRIGIDHVPDLFARNERVVIAQAHPSGHEVLTIMVGAIGVGRIELAFDDLQTNRGYPGGLRRYEEEPVSCARGDELGVFHLGSTAVVLLPAKSRLAWSVQPGDVVRVGQVVAEEAGS